MEAVKNLLTYINPDGRFDAEREVLVKVQIDNSLSLGWKPEDIMLVTNFEYEYNGVRAIVIPTEDGWCDFHKQASKVPTIIYLIKTGIVNDAELYWFHDFDAYQFEWITESELMLDGFDIGFTDYGWFLKFNTGSIFFRSSALDVFEWLRDACYNLKKDEERSLMYLSGINFNNINSRYKRLNVTYNFPGCLNGEVHLADNLRRTTMPVKVMHFHPVYKRRDYVRVMSGANRFGICMIPNRLAAIFVKHGLASEYVERKRLHRVQNYYGVNLRFRSGYFDKGIARQMIGHNPYRMPQNPKVVVDIGANIGVFSVIAAKAGAEVYAFEPEKSNFEMLSIHAKLNDVGDKIHCINKGVGKPGLTKLYIHSTNSGMGTSFAGLGHGLYLDRYQLVDFVSIREVFDLYSIGYCDLLKLDCEGSEVDILMDFDRHLAKRVGQISAEIHDLESPAILERRLSNWFVPTKVERFHWVFKNRRYHAV